LKNAEEFVKRLALRIQPELFASWKAALIIIRERAFPNSVKWGKLTLDMANSLIHSFIYPVYPGQVHIPYLRRWESVFLVDIFV
jgi:hypothetical protein